MLLYCQQWGSISVDDQNKLIFLFLVFGLINNVEYTHNIMEFLLVHPPPFWILLTICDEIGKQGIDLTVTGSQLFNYKASLRRSPPQFMFHVLSIFPNLYLPCIICFYFSSIVPWRKEENSASLLLKLKFLFPFVLFLR